MMNTQEFSPTFLASVSDSEAVRSLPLGRVVALGKRGGEVSILSGRVWLTSGGDPGDHVLGAGESFSVRDSGPILVETWSRTGEPAVIAWRPRSFGQRVRDRLLHPAARCWDLISPARRIAIGSVAAVAGFVAAGALFGPLADARVRASTAPAAQTASGLLHNAGGAAAAAAREAHVDGIDTGYGTRGAARQAGRGAPVAA